MRNRQREMRAAILVFQYCLCTMEVHITRGLALSASSVEFLRYSYLHELHEVSDLAYVKRPDLVDGHGSVTECGVDVSSDAKV